MLPWLLGALVVGAGKLIYDAVTDDSSSSSSSSSRGPSEEDIKAARVNEVGRQRKDMTRELLESTATDVSNLLEMHKDLVKGQAKSLKATQSVSMGALAPQAAWPFSTGSEALLSALKGAENSPPRDSILSEDDLRKAARSAGTASGLDMLTPLTDRLSYRNSHAKEQLKIKRMAAKRDALRALVEGL